MISRRHFLAAGTGLVTAGVALAQQSRSLPKVGVLRPQPPTDSLFQAFLRGMRELGYIDGKTMLIEYRHGPDDQLAEPALDLARANVSVIFAPNPPAAQAARKATTTIPIVVAVIGDPVRTGLAASLARPGGNVTGLTALGSDLSGKRLELLRDVVPRMSRLAVLWNPALPDKVIEMKELEAATRARKIELLPAEVRTPADFNAAFEATRRLRPDALIALGEPLVYVQRARIIEFAIQARLPVIFNWREAAEEGALLAYGPDVADLYRRAAAYVDRILKGANPGDLPIEQPTRFDFVVNNRTAKALGITIPQSILVRADRVIE